MTITFNNKVYATGFVGEDDGAASSGFSLDNVSANSISINGTVTKVGDSVVATGTLPGGSDTGITATTNTLYVTQYDNANMIEFSTSNPPTSTSFRFVLSNTMLAARQRVTFTDDSANGGPTLYTVTCFASGTLIRTATGDVAVEDLAVGDLVVTASGAHRPITWLGHRTVECARYPRAHEILPVRITAHAFGENRPARDLVLSPGHSVAVDLLGEALIPASSLVNGSTIRQEKVERVTYWHVELESHDLLLSENLATESYLEMGNRSFFVDGREVVALYSVPDAPAAKTLADFCRPYHAEGALVSFVRDRLKARAMQLGWAEIEDPLADIHLVVDGRRIEPEVRDLSARFLVPKTAQAVQLVSNAAVPMDVGVAADVRMLGLCVGRIVISDGFGGEDVIPADDPRLCIGFHHVEDGPQRWTTGSAKLPSDLWKGRSSDVFLRVELTRSALPRWIKSADPLVAVAPLALAG